MADVIDALPSTRTNLNEYHVVVAFNRRLISQLLAQKQKDEAKELITDEWVYAQSIRGIEVKTEKITEFRRSNEIGEMQAKLYHEQFLSKCTPIQEQVQESFFKTAREAYANKRRDIPAVAGEADGVGSKK